MIEEKLNSTFILNMGFMGTGVYEEVLFEWLANGMPVAVQQIELVPCRELLSIAEKDKRSFSS